ncbi:MAG TPA: hypothetical protein DEQ30_12535 [Porphyromonadaceae bacterium]|nr:hypothetical protein [Porphyromonadaceae bacterium]
MEHPNNNNNDKPQVENKPYHKKQLAALTDSMYEYPYQNLSLTDMEGEVWKPFPVAPFDEYYEISNKGRVKHLEQLIESHAGYTYLRPERIIKQAKNAATNHYLNQQRHSLFFILFFHAIRRTFKTSRIVYYTFVAPFDMEDPNLIVRFKDNNSLNVLPENLYLFERKKLTKWLVDHDRKQLRIRLGEMSVWPKEKIREWNKQKKLKICQYDLDGQFIAAYGSKKEASEISKTSSGDLSAAIMDGKRIAGGFLWRERYIIRTKITVSSLRIHNRPVKPQKVAQYDLDGNLIREFSSIRKAAQSNGLAPSTLKDRIRFNVQPKDFIWKAIEDSEIPSQKI